jgi:hypothetical protein
VPFSQAISAKGNKVKKDFAQMGVFEPERLEINHPLEGQFAICKRWWNAP